MPCPHKFADDLTLDRLDFNPTTLIIGTFNPGWENLGNTAQWFYGRTHNNYFWEVLPRLYGMSSLRQARANEWRAFCKQQGIALTDLIYSIDDADAANPAHVDYLKTYRDDLIIRHFQQINWLDIFGLLHNRPTISHVYLTRSTSGTSWRRQWLGIETYCQSRNISAKTLLTPSGSARFQMPNNSGIMLGDFIFEQWRRNWHFST
jgi:hypothetical protein